LVRDGVPVANPQAADKTILPLSGQTLRTEFNTDAKIISFIRSGIGAGSSPSRTSQQ
jgi:hypothetical protein